MAVPDYIEAVRRTYGQGLLLLPGVTGVVVDGPPGGERLLLVRRSDTGQWSLPAGIVEPGEQPAATLVREVLEETCVIIRPERLVLLTVDPPISYPNGDTCQFVSLTFRCGYLSGEAQVGDEESTDVAWFALSALPELDPRQHRRIRCGLSIPGPTEFDLS